jgi:hypothetical protein
MIIQAEFNTKSLRILYDATCDAIEYWPGSPARPAEQQVEYHQMKTFLFSMLCESSLEPE